MIAVCIIIGMLCNFMAHLFLFIIINDGHNNYDCAGIRKPVYVILSTPKYIVFGIISVISMVFPWIVYEIMKVR